MAVDLVGSLERSSAFLSRLKLTKCTNLGFFCCCCCCAKFKKINFLLLKDVGRKVVGLY